LAIKIGAMLNTSLSASPPKNNQEILTELATYYCELWKHHERAAELAQRKLSCVEKLLERSYSQKEKKQVHSQFSKDFCCNPKFHSPSSLVLTPVNGNRRFSSSAASEIVSHSQNRNRVEEKDSDRRKHIRFQQNLGTQVQIDIKIDEFNFTYSEWGQILDDSFGGCSLLVATKRLVELNQTCQLKLTDLEDPIEARIAWTKELAENIYKVGMQYTDL
jgi:hypothetical protein